MKTLFTFALVAFFFSVNLFARPSDNDHSNYDFIAEKIQASIQLPAQTDGNAVQSRVLVVFSINENGQVIVLEVGTANESLKASLVQQFEALQFDNSIQSADGMYSIWLNFKTL